MSKMSLVFLGLAFLCGATAQAAGTVAAIVERASGTDGAVQQMELLEEGRVIELGAGGTVTIGYPSSCLRETITGGRITIGREKSDVENGRREVQKVDCDGGQMVRASNQSDDVAGAVFRKGRFETQPLPDPDWVLYGVSPVIRLSKTVQSVRIERLDKVEDTLEVPVSGSWVDLEAQGIRLKPSAMYAISVGGRPYIIKVSPSAVPGAPMLSRLIVL